MPRTCTVCSHASRRKIDKAIVFGKSNRAIASQFHLTRASVQRHKQHVAAAIERAAEKRELSIGEQVLDRLERQYQRGEVLLASAERAKNHPACIGYLRELRGILGVFYQVAREATPQSTQWKALPEEYIAAISRALGVHGQLKPIGRPPLPSGNAHNEESSVDSDVLDVLPE